MKIRTKLIMGFGTIIIFMVILTSFGINRLYHVHNLMDNLTQVHYLKVSLASTIQNEENNIAKSMRNLVLLEDEDGMKQENKILEQAVRGASDALIALEKVESSEATKRAIMQLRRDGESYTEFQIKVIEAIKANDKTKAAMLLTQEGREFQSRLSASIGDVIALQQLAMSEAARDARQVFFDSLILFSFLFLLTLFIGTGITIALIRNISQGLHKVSVVMTDFVKGDGDLSARVEINSHDEIGQVASAFNTMAEVLENQAISEKIRNQSNADQGWIKEHVVSISQRLHEEDELSSLVKKLIKDITPLAGAQYGLIYLNEAKGKQQQLECYGSYGHENGENYVNSVRLGQGLVGQCALDNKPIYATQLPENYIKISSGLGDAKPSFLAIFPLLFEKQNLAVIELASFQEFTPVQLELVEKVAEYIAIVIASLKKRITIQDLLQTSQILTEESQAQSEELQSQSEELRMQQEELEQTNMILKEKAQLLEDQNNKYIAKNMEVEFAKIELERKAEQLSTSSKYKSEFLANMSHELRTPLNSMLILAKLLADNKEGNLSPKQVEYASTVHSSGHDLFILINEILDLSKVESGKMEVNGSFVGFTSITEFVKRQFSPIAGQKGLEFQCIEHPGLPDSIYTDQQLLQQILQNLLSNAFKFTNQGSVIYEVKSITKTAGDIIAFSVTDTGIGVAADKQEMIFDAFLQADGRSSRIYGGTGLGLSISRKLAELLGGSVEVESEEGAGSTFTLLLPDKFMTPDLMGSAHAGEPAQGLPAASEAAAAYSASTGGKRIDFTIAREKRLLIVEDDPIQRNLIKQWLDAEGLEIMAVSTVDDAMAALNQIKFDCMVLGLGLVDVTEMELLEFVKGDEVLQDMPIIIYTSRILTLKEEHKLRKYAYSIILKDGKSSERLASETHYLLHHYQLLNDGQSNAGVFAKEEVFIDKKILLVDDDIRNVFALSSVLESYRMQVIFAENGKVGLELLEQNPDIDLVLMDVMMPEMDGYQTMKCIRNIPRFQDLPIIAITAKAMKEDRDKCIYAGASDYITKPIPIDKLLSLMQVWFYK
ncbi:MAG TPA: response regulator [Bacilli bacterium]